MNRAQLPAQTLNWHNRDHPMPAGDPTSAELAGQAVGHERNRLESVAEVIAIAAIMVARGALTGAEIVSVGGAVFQHGKGDRELGIVAAHCLPGQLAFNGAPLHTSSDWSPDLLSRCLLKPLPLAAKLRSLGGRTDYVHGIVNQADSLVEILPGGGGLKPALGLAIARLFRDLTSCRPRDWETVQRLAAGALEFYRLEARQCCESRIMELSGAQAASGLPDTDVVKCSIIRHFLSIAGDRSLVPLNPAGFRQVVEDLVMPEHGLPAPPIP